MFYGVNGHYDYNQSIAQQVADVKMMGFTSYRATYEGNDASLTYLKNIATALKGTGITLVCCIDLSMCDSTGALFTSEALAYQTGFNEGLLVAQALVPLGVTIFECGNELDSKNNIRTYVGEQGGVAVDFQNSVFPALRGVMNGCMTAVRLVGGSKVKCASNGFTAASIAVADMLWDGTQPDGTSGHMPVRWDITSWHNYEDYGNPFDGTMSMDYQKPNINLCDHLKAKFGKPILFTEWNSKASNTDAERSAWATQFMTGARNAKDVFGIMGIMVYQLYCGDPWGVVNFDLTIKQSFGQTVKNFIAANPVA
jgi:hypothetical protein